MDNEMLLRQIYSITSAVPAPFPHNTFCSRISIMPCTCRDGGLYCVFPN